MNFLQTMRAILKYHQKPPRGRRLTRANFAAEVYSLEVRDLLSANLVTPADTGTSLWQEVESFSTDAAFRTVSYLNLTDYTPLAMNETAVRQTLDVAPDEATWSFSTEAGTIALVDPQGNLQRFSIFESQTMAPALAAQFPEIKTYSGQGIDDSTATVQIDLTPQGFHAQVLSEDGRWYVDPYYHLNDDFYASYYASNAQPSEDLPVASRADNMHEGDMTAHHGSDWVCCTECTTPAAATRLVDSTSDVAARSGSQLRIYRAAVAATGEYTAFHGGTVTAAQAAIVTTMHRVSGIYERELSIRLQLIGNNSSLIYTNAATDPYTNNDAGLLLGENQANIDAIIGNTYYDLGHVFSTAGGGLAYLGSAGIVGLKAQGETGRSSPVGDAFDVDYVAHEMGHQFGAQHTFNTASDLDNRAEETAYEPGSGSTIMGYAGVIVPHSEDLQPNSDDYFHSASFDQIINHVDSVIPNVGARTATGNHVPIVNAGNDYTIPAATPFKLTASSSDNDGTGTHTFNWEQRDLGPAQNLNQADNSLSPLFRSLIPTSDPSRTFPRLEDLLDGVGIRGERLPTRDRQMDFRVTVRDNAISGGGVDTDDMVVNVVDTGSAFALIEPLIGDEWFAGDVAEVIWDVAGTDGNGINCDDVRILLSTDGGLSFQVLENSVPNTGSFEIEVPDVATSQARIMIEAVGNIFFDVSRSNFIITKLTNAAPVIDHQFFVIPETAPVGTVVGTIAAMDPDLGQSLRFEVGAVDENIHAFAVNPLSGVITVTRPLSRNHGDLGQGFFIHAIDNGSPVMTSTAGVTIYIDPANKPPKFHLEALNKLMEGNQTTSGPVSMSRFYIEDDFWHDNTIELEGPDATRFEVTGDGYLNTYLGLKAGTTLSPGEHLSVDVVVSDPTATPSTPHKETFTLFVGEPDEDEGSFYFEDAPFVQDDAFRIPEDTAAGTVIGTLFSSAWNMSGLFEIVDGNTDGAFSINSNGELRVSNTSAISYEAQHVFDLRVTLTNSSPILLTGMTTVRVVIDDVNEFDPVATEGEFTLERNAREGTYVGTIPTTDDDTANSFTYSLLLGNSNQYFFVHASNGVITVANHAGLNADPKTQHSLLVRVSDTGEPERFTDIVLQVHMTGGNLYSPEVSPRTTTINENTPNNTVVVTVPAADSDPDQTLAYSIIEGNTNNAFAIHPVTGDLWVNNTAALNFEVRRQFDLLIKVEDNGNPSRWGTGLVKILLKDVNEFNPVVGTKQFLINENSANNAFIGTIPSTDADTLQTRSYAITGGNVNNAFSIHPGTGELRVNNSAALNFETVQQFNLTVTATDNGSPARTGSAVVTVFLRDVNETPPVVAQQTFQIHENTANNTLVGTVIATDQDTAQTHTFAITAGNMNNAFAIDAGSGQLRVNNSAALNFETHPTFSLTITATDNGNPIRSGSGIITVNLLDVLENTAPAIGGLPPNQPMNDSASIRPFADITITDSDNQNMLARVTILNGVVRGDFTPASVTGWNRTVSGNNIVYNRFYNPQANIGSVVQAALRTFVFVPRNNVIKPNTTELTDITVFVNDSVANTTATTRLTTTSVNNAPTIGGASNTVAVNDNATVNPFATLTVTDADMQEMLITVTILNGAVRGDFTNATPANGWATRITSGNNITYKRYLSPQANIGAVAQAAFRALVFQPRQNAIKPNTIELTDFQVTVSDGVAPAIANQGTRVTTTSVNNAPTIGGATANQTMNDNQTRAVFSTLTVTDPDTQDLSVRITITNGTLRGDFTPAAVTAGWIRKLSGANIVYERFFAAAANNGAVVQAAIRALVFQPRTNVPVGTTETTSFTVFVNDGIANATNSTTSVITTGIAPRQAPENSMASRIFLDADITTLVWPTIDERRLNSLDPLLTKAKD